MTPRSHDKEADMRRLLRWLLGDPRTCAADGCEVPPAVGRFCFDHAVTTAGDPWRG